MPKTSLAMDQEEKKQVQYSLPDGGIFRSYGKTKSHQKPPKALEKPKEPPPPKALEKPKPPPKAPEKPKLTPRRGVIKMMMEHLQQQLDHERKALEKPKPRPKAPEKPKLTRRGQIKGKVFGNLLQHFGHKRKDVAASLEVSKPPDQHGERNTSTACETPSHNVQTWMEGELFGQNEVASVFRRDFMGGPIALNTESGLIMGIVNAKLTSVFNTIPHLIGDSSECAFQVKNQSTQFTANPYPNGLVDPHPQIALTQILSENMERLEDRRNLLAPQKEPPDNSAHLVRANQSGPIMHNSGKKHTSEGLIGECLTESVLSLDDSTKRKSFPDFDATENKAHLVRAYQSGPVVSLSENKNEGEALKRECITKSILGLGDLQQHCGGRSDAAAKSFRAIYDPGLHTTDSVTWKSFEVLETHRPREQQSNATDTDQERQIQTQMCNELSDARGGRPDAATKSFRAIYDPGFHTPDSVARKSFEVLETLPARKQPNDGVPLLLPGRLTLEGCVQQEKSPDLPRVMQFNGVERRVTKMPRYLEGLTAQSTSSSCGPIGLPDGGHIVLLDALDQSTKNIEHVATADQCSPTLSFPEKKMVRKTLNRNCRTMSVIFEEKHQRFVRRCEGATKSLGAMCIGRKYGINQVSKVELIHKQRGIHQWPFLRFAVGLPDGGHILSLLEKKIVRKTLKRKCRSMSVLSLEDHKQHVDRRWEDVAKSHGAKRICRQLVIHHLSTAKCIRKQLGIHQWPFQQSTIGLPDGGHILPLSEKKIVRKTLKRKCRSMSVLSLVDRQQHVDWRWEDAAKNIGAKRICRQLVIHRVSIAKRICRQHGIHHRWPFQHSAIGLPDGGHILPLSEKKIVRKTLKRKCRSMSVIRLVDRQQHVDRRWKDATKNIGAKRICRQLVIHHVSIAKCMCRQHGIHHRWPFERDWATKKGYSLGDERPVEVISLTTHAELVSRLQLIYISWLGRFSPRPSAFPRGGLIVGPIALSSSEFAATNNLAQHVGQDQRASGASGSENERTREQEDPKEIRTSITKDDLLQLHGRMTRKDAAAILQVSVSTVKRKCQEYKIGPWKNGGRKRVWRPPDQHGKRNTSTACETPSHNVQTWMEGELFGQNEVANVFRRDFMGGPIALNTESGLIMVSRPPDQHGERNTSTACGTPSCNVETAMEVEPVGQNQEANVFRRDFTEGPTALNTENGLIIGSSSEWASQVNDQSTLSNPYQNHNALVFPQPQITSMLSENRGGSIDWGNSLASQAEPFSDRLISRSIWRPPDQLEGQTMQFTAHPNPNALVLPQFQIASSQVSSANEGRIASQVEAFFVGQVSESSNLAFPEYSDAAAPSQPVATILTERQGPRSVKVKATYGNGNRIIKFPLPLTSGIKELMQEVSKTLDWELGSFDVDYKDEDGDWILMARDDNVSEYLQLLNSLGNQATKLEVRKKDPDTTDICETCGSLKQQRP